MKLSGVKPGDIVHADLEYLMVMRKDGRVLICAVTNRAHVIRRVKARDVTGHWRKAKTS